jgi:hypothetical protein
MRIVHLSTSDTAGGAARAAFRLHTGLKRLGHQSTMLVLRRVGKDPDVKAFKPPADLVSRMRMKLRARRIDKDLAKYEPRPAGFEMFSDDRSPFAEHVARQIPPCDLINLHWVSDYIDHLNFFPLLPKDVPVVWRLADMAALTSGCHYDHGCGRFTAQCGACPQLGSNDERPVAPDLDAQVARAWQPRAGAAAPRRHEHVDRSESRRSSLLKQFPVTVIPNGLDVSEFTPRDKAFRATCGTSRATRRSSCFAAESVEQTAQGVRATSSRHCRD